MDLSLWSLIKQVNKDLEVWETSDSGGIPLGPAAQTGTSECSPTESDTPGITHPVKKPSVQILGGQTSKQLATNEAGSQQWC